MMVAERTWLGRRPLEVAISWYRRHVSGRGPLRRVTCTFGRCESCSAYGLRVVREHARSLPHALRLVFGRIRRCRTASVHHHEHALSWGEDYDRGEAIDDDAVLAHEQPRTRGALLWAAIGVARYRGQRRLVQRLAERLRARWLRRLVVPALLVGLGLVLPLVLAAVILAVGVAAAIGATRRFVAERRRLDEQLRFGRLAST